jgi:acyl-CoA hydrolase
MDVKTISMCRLVKGGDLNHHGTLFAGRGAEWFVEAGFIAAASLTSPESTVCLKIHGMVFSKPVEKGSLIRCESKVIYAGRTSLIAYVKIVLHPSDEFVVDGFLTFINVDEQGKPKPHNISIEATLPEDIQLLDRVKAL